MSTSVSKSFTLSISDGTPHTLDGYWTMEETLAVPRVDKVHSIQLVPQESYPPGSMDWTAVAGKQGNAFNVARTAYANPVAFGILSSDVAGSGGTCIGGASLAFWVKLLSAVGVPDYQVDLSITTDSVLVDLQLIFRSSAPHFTFGGSGSNWVLDGLISLPFDVWNFVHIFFDGDKVGISVNNGSEITHGSGIVGGPIVNCSVLLENDTNIIDRHLYIDELAMGIHGRFTPSQIAYLYNGGAGRTWPITLP